jgi:predicted membrane protein (TIGR00267 family)
MPTAPHVESHFEASETVRDVVIGMADGLTVPFALAAGLSGTVASTAVVVIAGLAEIAAGSIAMGLGGYLAARTDRDHYLAERAREIRETVEIPEKEHEEVAEVFRGFEEPDPQRARNSAVTIALSYIVGGMIPLAPYMLIARLSTALSVSVAVTLAALFVFGYGKGKITGISPFRGGLQTVVVGGLASAAAYGLARLIS